jgi:hypothetical protein
MAYSHTGPLPTIADTKRLGMSGLRVECSTLYCHHEKRVGFDALGLPDDTVFLDIPKLRRFVCEKCGGREAKVGADWNEYYDAMNKRRTQRLNEQSPR